MFHVKPHHHHIRGAIYFHDDGYDCPYSIYGVRCFDDHDEP